MRSSYSWTARTPRARATRPDCGRSRSTGSTRRTTSRERRIMAVDTLKTGMPPEHDLSGGYTIRVDAIDPTTGATVSGINVSNVIITARNLLTGAVEQI